MFYTYIIKSTSHPNQRYIGYTSNMKQRLIAHNNGKCKHTIKFVPWELKFFAAFPDKSKAIQFEKYLKTGSGFAFSQKHF